MSDGNQGDNTVFLPSDPEAAPRQGQMPSHIETPRNLAGDSELCDKVRSWSHSRVVTYEGQDARNKMVRTGGTMDIADRMWRVSLRRNTSNDQNEDTHSNVTSTAFFRAVRAVTAGENMVYFNTRDLPAQYEPEVDTDEYSVDQGKLISDQQNMLEEYTFDEDKRTEKIKELVWSNNKYGNAVVSVQWQRITKKQTERVPARDKNGNVILNANGTVQKFTWKDVDRAVVDWPVLQLHDLKDCFFDSQIDSLQDQQLYAIRCKRNIQDLRAEQESGYLMNVEKINAANLYQGESGGENDPLRDRQTNADEGGSLDRDGMIEVWDVWGCFPIKENSNKRKVGGKWDAGKNPAVRYWATFAGTHLDGNSVCLRLVKNPNYSGMVPHKLLHSHRDDKGAYHDGFASMLQSLYEQATVNRNQMFDNITLINQAPWILDGPLLTRNMKFRANKIAKVARGTNFKQADVRDASQATSAAADIVERDIEKTVGADRPIVGEALGSRTSATEAKQVLDQALVPLDDKAGYFADQFFTWLLEMDMALWRQYGDPKTVRRITRADSVVDLIPSQLWGPLRTKVTAINRFKSNVQRRQDFNSFFQNVFPQAKEYMGPQGGTKFMRDAFHEFGFENAQDYFPIDASKDSIALAKQALAQMIQSDAFIEPEMGQNHSAWLSVFRPALLEYETLSGDERDEEIMQKLRQHIIRREALMAQEGQGQMAPQGGEMPRGLPGEMGANQMEAMEGAVA